MKHLRRYGQRRRAIGTRLLVSVVLTVGYLCILQPLLSTDLFQSNSGSQVCGKESQINSVLNRHILSTELEEEISIENDNATSNETKKTPLFPRDLFTMEQRRHGAVSLHVFGMIYMFIALAIVCDEFFIPALDVIIEKLEIQEDVAGATFMAAGGSAPELFTSVIGVFVSFDDVGIGTIVGSAVFNILFVIGMCAMFSRSVLNLTWWPLFRDVSFYSISLIILIVFFLDNLIKWWEAFILLSIYAAYVYFMKWNFQFEQFVKKFIGKNKVTRVSSADQLVTSNGAPVLMKPTPVMETLPPSNESGSAPLHHRRASTPLIHAGSKFRHGLLQLMIHSIDPMNEGGPPETRIDEKSTQIHAIASLKVLLDATRATNAASAVNSTAGTTAGGSETDSQDLNSGYATSVFHPTNTIDFIREDSEPVSEMEYQLAESAVTGEKRMVTTEAVNQLNHVSNHVTNSTTGGDSVADEVEENKEPLDISWPDSGRKRFTYIFLAPIVFPLYLTLPDPRRPEKKKWFALTFIGSIAWIAIFSYLMVWWASLAGETLGIPNEVMGLTILAAGTSIPDLITSVIVARKGLGDMAVSSSIGSNIFDVTVG
ncbi:hypothetical protein CHUAL_000452 [Chamberlinius hualienensis]